ncbi:hypothetical protein LCGC14_3062990, partial [marine sediment metagenome]
NDCDAIGFDDSFTKQGAESAIKSALQSAPPIPLDAKYADAAIETLDQNSLRQDGAKYQQATMNSLQTTLHQMMAAAKNSELSGDELQTMAETFHIAVDSLISMSGKIQVVSGMDASRQAGALYQKALTNPQRVQGFKSGLTKLDFLIGGFPDGQSYTFLGATGSGKTQLCAVLAYNFGLDAPGMIISMENDEPVFIMRMWAYLSGIPFGDIKRGGKALKDADDNYVGFKPHTEDERARIQSAQGKVIKLMAGGTQMLAGNPLSPAVIRAFVRKQTPACKWLLIDSLNNIQLPFQSKEYEDVTSAAMLCEQLATGYNIPVINTVQIGRNTKGRASKEPGIHDARGSGIVEEKA